MMYRSKMLASLIALALVFIALGPAGAQDNKGPALIQWNTPNMVDRITGQGPVEVIPEYYDDYGVKVSGKKGMLEGYQLPEGWKQATAGVKELTLTNSGSLPHDPATVINAKIFEKMTGIHLNIIEMKDAMLWPKTLSVVMAKSTDVDLFYTANPATQVGHLSAADWIHPVDELWPPEVRKLYPKQIFPAIRGIKGHYYGTPFCHWAFYLYYRPSWLEKAGVEVPETWQELVVASKKVDEWAKENLGPGYVGMLYSAGTPQHLHALWSMAQYSQGERIMQDGKVVLDPEAWELMTDLWLKGGVSKASLEYTWSAAPEVFAKGKAGFIPTAGVYMNLFADPEFAPEIQDDWAATFIPGWEGVSEHGASIAYLCSWWINNFISPEKKAAAMLWMDFQRSYTALFNELYYEGNEATMTDIYNHPAVKEKVPYQDLRKASIAAQIAETYPPGMMQIVDIVKEYLGKVALGQMGADEALQKAQAEINKIV